MDNLRITSATEGAVIPRLYGRMRIGGNIIWATDFPRGNQDHHAGRWQGRRRWRQGQDHRILLLRQLRESRSARGRSPGSAASGPTASCWTPPGSPGAGIRAMRRRRPIRSSRRRWAQPTRPPIAARPMSSSRTCRSQLRQPHPAAEFRGVPPARRSGHRRGADAGGHHDPGVGRVHLCHAGHPEDRWRRVRAREPERADRHHRHGGGAGPLQAMAPKVESVSACRGLVRRRSARGLLQGAARRRGHREIDHAVDSGP
jgi:hypothetical protein